MKRIKRFGIYQTSKVAAITWFLLTALFMIPFALLGSLMNNLTEGGFYGMPFGGGMFLIVLPFLYGIIGFITTAIGCFIYNIIAKWTGGIAIEFEVEEETKDKISE